MEFTGGNAGDEQARPKIMRQGYPVPAELIGFIIGKGGANIDQIQNASSAKLSTKDDSGPRSFQREWVYIQIEGTGREVSPGCALSVVCVCCAVVGRLFFGFPGCPSLVEQRARRGSVWRRTGWCFLKYSFVQ